MKTIKIVSVKCFILLLTIIAMTLLGRAQKNYFVVEKPGTVKNYKYLTGDRINLLCSPNNQVTGRISRINDSLIEIDRMKKVYVHSIIAVYQTRRLFALMADIGIKAGGGFFILDLVNALLTKRQPIIKPQTLIISGSLIGVALASLPLMNKKMIIDNENWRIRILCMEN